ncbi:MAG: hypothetical protein R3A13_11490 [Bdellovibrionota bacterium]
MKLTKEDILRLFDLLNESLKQDKIVGELYLMGGAVMCLAFNARASTKDIDCVFEPSKIIREKSTKIAKANGLAENWLNAGVKGFLSDNAQFESYLDLSNLKVLTCKPEYLLAMKCLAMRIGEEFQDEADVMYLLRYLNLESFDQVLEVITCYYPKERFPQKTFCALEEMVTSKT